MAKTISATVGKDSAGRLAPNRLQDVINVEQLLNQVPPAEGGPTERLLASGSFTQQTFLAICRFQERKFGWADGLIEPGQRTLAELNKFDKVAPSPTWPAKTMRVVGEQQQLFRGDSGDRAPGDMELLSFSMGLADLSGEGPLKRIDVVKQVGPSTPQFFLAAVTAERLNVWINDLNIERRFSPSDPGTDMHLTLSNAIVDSVRSLPSEIHTSLQQISFTCEQISWDYNRSGFPKNVFLSAY